MPYKDTIIVLGVFVTIVLSRPLQASEEAPDSSEPSSVQADTVSTEISERDTEDEEISNEENEQKAKAAYRKALEKYDAQEFEAAADLFRKAYGFKPAFRIYYNIAQSEMSAKRYGLALEAYQNYLAEGGDDILEDRRKQVIKASRDLQLMVGTIEISASSGCVVDVDGVRRGVAPIIRRILLSVATQHHVMITCSDQVAYEEDVILNVEQNHVINAEKATETVIASQGEPEELRKEEQALPIEVAQEEPEESAPVINAAPSHDKKLDFVFFISFASTTGVLGITSFATNLAGYRILNKQDAKDPIYRDKDKINQGENLRVASIVTAVGAMVFAVPATIFGIRAFKKEEQMSKRANFNMSLTPVVNNEFQGVLFTGEF